MRKGKIYSIIKINNGLRMRDTKGFTLIEILVAMAILGLVLVGMAMMISTGFVQMNNLKIQRSAANCARMVMEYLETLPPDLIYGLSPQANMQGDFASGGGIGELNDFVNNGNSTCRTLSDTSSRVGKQVKLKYNICPGCVSRTQQDSYGVEWTTCEYFVKVRITYNGLTMGHGHTIDYATKFYEGAIGSCTDTPNGCGSESLTGGDSVRDCVLP